MWHLQGAAHESEEAVLASNQPPATSSHISQDTTQAPLSALAGRAADHAITANPQPQSPWLESDQPATEEAPISSGHATDNQQTGNTSEPLDDCVNPDSFILERPSSAAPDDHLCKHRLKPEVSSASLATSSSKSDGCSPPASPTSNTSAPAMALTAVSVAPGIDPQVAVLSVLAGVAADPASALMQPPLPDAADTSAGSQPATANPLAADCAGHDSNSASRCGLDIFDALREDRTCGEDWQVVKASRKGSGGSIKATLDTSERQAGAAQQHGMAGKRREQLTESHARSQEAAQESVNSHADVVHVTRPVRRSSSQASISSWASVDTTDTHDRYSRKSCKQEFYPLVISMYLQQAPLVLL